MERIILIVFVLLANRFCEAVVNGVAPKNDSDHVCMQPMDDGSCFRILERMWYYDHESRICRIFYYGGCGGGNDNRFSTEEACYAVCYEQLMMLHPPQNLTVGYMQHDKIFVYWYRPINFELHVPNDTATGNPIANHIITQPTSTPLTTSNVTSDVKPGIKTTANPPIDPSTTSPQTSVNTTNDSKVDVNSDGNKNVTDNNNNVTTVTTDSSVLPVKHIVATAVNSSKVDNSGDNSGGKDKVVDLGGGVNLTLSDYIGKNPVPFHFAKLKHYILSYRKEAEDEGAVVTKTIPGNETEATIDGLDESAVYHISVAAVYLTNTSVSTPEVIAGTRRDPSKPRECHCDKYGTLGGYKTCNLTIHQLPWCECKKEYAGLFCEICAQGYYRTTPSLPCHRCPCDSYSSSGSCHFSDSYLICSRCNMEYAGQLCHRCANGYYRDLHLSPAPCKKCEGCHNVLPGLICDPFKGNCLNCYYNTTGHKCDKCLDGYVGDPTKNISCVQVAGKEEPILKAPPTALIIAIVLVVIIVLSVIIGCVVYNRMRPYPAMKQFWKVELKQDHEGVNFSSVPDRDVDGYRDDEQYYEQESKKSKSQPYSQLKEEY